ncbi:MAG: GIY-YIG nuclease family protein [Terriglobia bacterium]
MKIEVEWSKPYRLRDGSDQNLTYACSEFDSFPEGPGVYVFARRHGNNASPLYIGQALRLKKRIAHQFNNNRLMNGIQKAQAGKRILLLGRLMRQQGQQVDRALDVLESALIEYALSQGHDLQNKQGTKTPVHVISFRGNRTSRHIAPLHMPVRRKAK